MRICIVNNSEHSDGDVQHVLRVINAQLVEFAYQWSVVGQCRLEGSRGRKPKLKELRGDAIIYLQDGEDPEAAGWHDADKYGVPYGVVYVAEEPWSVTLSHEVLELMLDPHVNRLAAGPHPRDEDRTVMHWYEACDAVQGDTYEIAGVPVSDFVLPAYFTPGEERGMRMSHLGADIKSFGIAPGGYVGFYDPATGEHDVCFADLAGQSQFERKKHRGRIARYLNLAGRPAQAKRGE